VRKRRPRRVGKWPIPTVYSVMSMPRRSERPTTPPLFDAAEYAKDSEARIRNARRKTDGPPSSLEHAAARPDGTYPAPPAHDPQGSGEESARPETPYSETRLATRPTMGATITDEAWARAMVGAPVVLMPPDQLRRLPLDHRAGFLLSLMDGTIDLATVIEVSAMPSDGALRVVRDLFDAGVVAFR
jgi:hypothetical protein